MKRFLLSLLTTFLLVQFVIPLSIFLSAVIFLPLVFFVYIIFGGWPWLRILQRTLPRDLFLSYTFLKISMQGTALTKKNFQIHHAWLETVAKNRNKIAISFQDRKITFSQLNQQINQLAHYFAQHGITQGDTIGLYSENRIEFVCVWLAFSKIGVATALINNNLLGKSLIHSLQVASCKGVIFSPYCVEGISGIREDIGNEMIYFSLGEIEAVNNSGTSDKYRYAIVTVGVAVTYTVEPAITATEGTGQNGRYRQASERCPTTEPVVRNLNRKSTDSVFYIFTSGTTGMPKACKFTHIKYRTLVCSIHKLLRFTPDDVIYNVLPLYHTNGNVLAMGQTVVFGCENVLRVKFSASQFWVDCCKYNCSIFIYIGELCRYLLAQPENELDSSHRIRLAFGNGLKPSIWRKFQTRFNIPRIGEFYGATEGNANILNNVNEPGSVGYAPISYSDLSFLRNLAFIVLLIKLDPDTGEVVRNADGTCQLCGFDEPDRRFDGYVNAQATQSKMIQNVEKKGDKFFRTGDILTMDQFGYFRFCDRSGDTFRWKGENVSTAEVEGIITSVLDLKDVVVYGVQVPGTDGRAGMAAIADESLDTSSLYPHLSVSLPVYARPVFLRLTPSVELTGTFKLMKKQLKEEGFDPGKVSNQLFYLDMKNGRYVEIDKKAYSDIVSGTIRV